MNKELRYLSFQAGYAKKDRLFDNQRQQLETRANFIHNVQANPNNIYLDPVLRHHLGLDQLPAKPKK